MLKYIYLPFYLLQFIYKKFYIYPFCKVDNTILFVIEL